MIARSGEGERKSPQFTHARAAARAFAAELCSEVKGGETGWKGWGRPPR